ncbi:MaoC/PaaZ C-terminal domain-containing protein [Nitrospirillum viridazoti]|uniref:MaoC-like domain-containing protein n=1 Tax=Nitrospirillum viridazoti CBAmc TaxID=1441467 RepID=A0A248K3R9_9PROT|nr:MaoC/PaaZ C-terminal domain-containing protein [Nitrospirillum amazonense]ASG25088.1 hypothetical protein Y958_29385 [Nitrospirillum amazonense CBAmc]
MTGADVIGRRIFNDDDQRWFAALSGDWNPMHMDAIAARRTQAGAQAIHGVHGVLWALETLSAIQPLGGFNSLTVKFERFIGLNSPVQLRLVASTATSLRMELAVDGSVATIILLKKAPVSQYVLLDVDNTQIVESGDIAVREHSLEQLIGLSGSIVEAAGPDAYEAAYPHLSGNIGAVAVGGLATLSRLVGQVSPGLHSIFQQLTISFKDIGAQTPQAGVRFKNTTVDERFRLVSCTVDSSAIAGMVKSSCRHPPTVQPSLNAVAALVRPDEFTGAVALIIGGSRGLGELTAKIVAAGGGKVILTYAVGKTDAERVQSELVPAGASCDVLHYDVRGDVDAQLGALTLVPTHVYYFATPKIFRTGSAIHSVDAHAEFFNYYVNSFYNICDHFNKVKSPLSVFYPSSVAVAERPAGMTDYAMAKVAGEILAQDIDSGMPAVRTFIRRLPRLDTDQTASLVTVQTEAAIDVLLPMIREFHHAEVKHG